MKPVTAEYPVDPLDRTGWKKLEGKTASIFIPPSYEVLDFAGVFIELMFDVAKSVIKRSYPELKDETVEDFIANNMTDVFKILPLLAGLPNIDEEAKKLFEK